jgi:predicted amidohydrolase YtcJ
MSSQGRQLARVLLRGGVVHRGYRTAATAMLTVDGAVAWLGDDDAATGYADDADLVVDLGGRLVTPGFVDAHAHLASTGFALQSVDLSGTSTLTEALDALSAAAGSSAGQALFAHGWDETRWAEGGAPTGPQVDRAVGGRIAYVCRVDGHSAVVSTALLERCPEIAGVDGWRGDGVVERDAHHAVRRAFDRLRTAADRRSALEAALTRAASRGITSVHELNAPHIAPFDDFAVIAEIRQAQAVPEVVPYWGEHLGTGVGDDVVVGLAGDLCVDGAIGSRTAAMAEPYADADTSGYLYLDSGQIRDHVVACTRRGKQAGFHVIGDRAAREVMDGFTEAADIVGVVTLVSARHRLEHIEMPDDHAMATMARLGIVASVQPAFDAAWGAPGQLYERRLGQARSGPMNPFGSMLRAGVTLAFGSDSPVTPLDPWSGVRAAMWHHLPSERLTAGAAFDAHTRGGHRARRDDHAGVLAPDRPATYAVWELGPEPNPVEGLPQLHPDLPLPRCVRTVVAGTTVFSAEDV